MSEQHEHEHEEDEAAGEPVSLETEIEEEEAEAEAAETHEPEEEPVEASSAPRDDKEIEKVYKSLDKRAISYGKGVGELLKDGGIPVAVCELCANAYPGLRWTTGQQNERARDVLGAIGLGSIGDLKYSPYHEPCETCNAEGEVLSGSKRPEQRTLPCEDCNARGWKRREDAPMVTYPPAAYVSGFGTANGENVTHTEGAIDPAEAKRRMDAAIAQAKGGG